MNRTVQRRPVSHRNRSNSRVMQESNRRNLYRRSKLRESNRRNLRESWEVNFYDGDICSNEGEYNSIEELMDVLYDLIKGNESHIEIINKGVSYSNENRHADVFDEIEFDDDAFDAEIRSW